MHRFIMSAFRSDRTQADNLVNHADLMRHIEALGAFVMKTTVGCYQEEQANEPSIEAGVYFEMRGTDSSFDDVLELAQSYQQDAFLFIDNVNTAILIKAKGPQTGEANPLGVLRSCTDAEAKGRRAWSYYGGSYHIVN